MRRLVITLDILTDTERTTEDVLSVLELWSRYNCNIVIQGVEAIDNGNDTN